MQISVATGKYSNCQSHQLMPYHLQLVTEMSLHRLGRTLLGFLWAVDLLVAAMGDVGTATSYSPPYLSTKCPGYSKDQLPDSGLFVAASSGIWDNGAACSRKYRIKCLSGLNWPCKQGNIVAEVVDMCRVKPCPSTLVLSDKAFDAVSKIPNSKINIEYARI